AAQVVSAVERIRRIELKKPPSVSETLDWARSLVLLNAETLSPELVASTLNVVLKHASDVEKVRSQLGQTAAPAPPPVRARWGCPSAPGESSRRSPPGSAPNARRPWWRPSAAPAR